MNELFAADPAICSRASELKLLLSSFGPYAGRYLANYPENWTTRVESQFENLGEVEAAKVQVLLRRAKDNLMLVTRSNLLWNSEQEWLVNAAPLLNAVPRVLDGLVAKQAAPPAIHQLDSLDLPPTAEERVAGNANEYARIAKILLLLSPEVAFVDPYLNPLKKAYSSVLKALFDHVAKGKCKKIYLWVRASVLLSSGNPSVIKADLEDALNRLARQAGLKPGQAIEMILVDDESQKTKMHGRYLLSIKGGIRLDQGFQELPQGRHVDVGPIGKTIHNDLLDIYFDGKHDMQVVERFILKF